MTCMHETESSVNYRKKLQQLKCLIVDREFKMRMQALELSRDYLYI